MVSNFYEDLARGRKAEALVKDVFSSLTDDFTFEDVGAERAFFYCGDIKATDKSGKEIFIEVKDDSRIADTRNILCEEEVYYKKNDFYIQGNMYSDYDIYTIVSQPERKIYVIDFEILKEHYRKGEYKEIAHAEQTSYCYLLPLRYLEQQGGLIATIDYSEKEIA